MNERRRAWFRGETPEQLRRQAAILRHPIRWAIIFGVGVGLWTGVWFAIRGGVEPGVAALLGALCGVVFGPGTIWRMQRKAHERGRVSSPAADEI